MFACLSAMDSNRTIYGGDCGDKQLGCRMNHRYDIHQYEKCRMTATNINVGPILHEISMRQFIYACDGIHLP